MEIKVEGFKLSKHTPQGGSIFIREYTEVENHVEIQLAGKRFLFSVNNLQVNISEDLSNCGIMNISCFGGDRWTLRNIKSLESNIKNLIITQDLERNFLMGTINEYQKNTFGSQFEKCGWNISYLFKNDNTYINCYLITKKLFE